MVIDTDDLGILPRIRVPMHVGTAVAEIEHPVLLNACPGVNRPLHKSVSAQRRAGHLHDEVSHRGMAERVVAKGYDGHVRFRLGVVEQRQRALDSDNRQPTEGDRQRFGESLNGVRVSSVLGRHCHQCPLEQFHSLALERASFDESIVLSTKKRPNPFRCDVGETDHRMSIAVRRQ